MTMRVNLKNFQGQVHKKATIQSNDPQTPELVVKVEGTILPIIDVKPSTNIVFRGMADQVTDSILSMISTTDPFHITDTESSLAEDIDYKLETVEEGKKYSLKISNKVKRGNYAGFIRLKTDLPQKPDIMIRVSGFIEGEISVKPQNILAGKLSANQPERLGKVIVTSNRNKPFEITKLTYDENLMSITQEPDENETGFILEVQPKLENIPVGSRKQTPLTIETNTSPDEKVEVIVYLFNSADQPEAVPK